MPLEAHDQLHLRAAAGYIGLEMFEDANNAELEEICRGSRCLDAQIATKNGNPRAARGFSTSLNRGLAAQRIRPNTFHSASLLKTGLSNAKQRPSFQTLTR